MKKLVVVWLAALCLTGTALSGCAGSREAKQDEQAQVTAILQPAMIQALDSLEQAEAKVKAGDVTGARQQFQTFAAALGKVLGPVSLKDPLLAQRMANANSAMKRAFASPKVDPAVISQEAGKITEAMHQSTEALGMPLLAKASGQVGAHGAQPPARTLEVHAREYRFTPDKLEVDKGTRLTVRLVNNGTMKHEWELDALGVEIKPVSPGASSEVTFVVDKPGTYEYVCRVDRHDQKGMRGYLIVK